MKTKRKLIVIALQIILVIVFVMGYKTYVDFSLQPVTVFGYSSDLEAGTKITQRDLIKISVSQMTLNPNMITEEHLDQLVGKYTKMDVVGNSIIYTGQISETSGVDKFASLDLSNSRVISIPVSYLTAAMGDFQRGDTVDLLYTASAATEGGEETFSFTYSKIFMPGVTVYQVNTGGGYVFTPHAHMKSTDTITLPDGTQSTPNYEDIASVSLIVTPEQAEELRTRAANGTIEIIKRFDESETHETLGFVIGNYGKIFAGNASTETGNISVSDSFSVGSKDDAYKDGLTNNTETVTSVQDVE